MRTFPYAATLFYVLTFLSYGTLPAKAQFLCSLGVKFNCSVNQETARERVAGTDIGDDVIGNRDRAAANMNNYFQVLNWEGEAPGSGYVRVTFKFEATPDPSTGELAIYRDGDQEAQRFFRRTIVDWARSLFVSEQRTYIVTLSATDRSSGETYWVEPIMAFEYRDGFNLIQISDDLAFNGNSRFYTRASEEIELAIDVRHAVTAELPADIIEQIFESAGTLARLFDQDVLSIVEASAVGAVMEEIQGKLSRFETSRDLSRSIVAKMENDHPVGMRYHFFAPEVRYTPFILHVGLEYKESLLSHLIIAGEEQSELSTSNVMTSFVKPRNSDNVQSLAAYFASHPTSTDASTILATQNGNTVTACRDIAAAAAEIYEPVDVALALLAYLTENIGIVGNRANPDCFSGSDRVYLDGLNLRPPRGFNTAMATETERSIRRLDPIEFYFGQYLTALGVLIKFDEDFRAAVASSIAELSRQASEGGLETAIILEDPGEVFLPGGAARRIFPTDFVNALLTATFEHAGCWERTIHSDLETDPNVVGVLFGEVGSLFEAKVQFQAETSTDVVPSDIKISRIVISPVDDALLSAYETAYGGQACKSGWSPWSSG